MAVLFVSCKSTTSDEFNLKKIQSKNPEISTLQNGSGFEQQVLQIKPDANNQSLVIWEGENAEIWAAANYLVCEIWHSNDFSAVLNVEFFRKENQTENIIAQSGDLAGDEKETPRMAAKIGVLPHLKTKVVFPLEILPWVVLGAAMFHATVSFAVWIAAYSFLYGVPHSTIFLLPLVLLPLTLLIMGISWLLASLGVYLRDVSQFVGILTTILMFLSPVFYPASALPEKYRALLLLNPLTPAIEQTRNVLFWGKFPSLALFGVYLLITGCIAWLGFAWFQKTRKGFADVL